MDDNKNEIRTFVFSQLPEQEKDKFMEFMINNNVEFVQDSDSNYIATICIRINNDQNNENKKSDEGNTLEKPEERDNTRTPPVSRNQILKDKNSDFSKSERLKVSPYSAKPSVNKAQKNYHKSSKSPSTPGYSKQTLPQSVEPTKQKRTPRRKVAENEMEYEAILSLSGKPAGIRPKRMNISSTIICMEDLYTARFIRDTSYFKAQLKKGNSEEISDKPFPNFIYEFYKKKHKANKKLVQQNIQDLICSIELHRRASQEADLFASFLSQKYDARDLVFFLYTRCLLEKEIGVKFSAFGKVNPIKVTDPRNVSLSMKTCKKIAQIFFEEDENELKNFLNAVQGKIDENYDQNGTKRIQCVAFLILLLDEFHISKNTNSSMHKSVGIMDNPFEDNEDEEKYDELVEEKYEDEYAPDPQFQPPPLPPDDSIPEDSKEESNILEKQPDPEIDELKAEILNHIQDNRISQLISYMLKTVVSRYEEPMEEEMMSMLESEIKEALFSKISDLINSLFNDSLEEWLELLMIHEPNETQLNYYEKCRDEILQTSQLGDQLTLDNIDDIAKMVLQTTELKQELAKLINTLVSQVQEGD
ncbi:unnamed protein product [Moneuplotes crassus]|uniref:Uncharacterized protein n=1 Tax=Euplotes crassus TaxID=5936 RepID=A0AAD1X5N8_EUPCR|nr:unnamed protein product [Moneuplotes crassus]